MERYSEGRSRVGGEVEWVDRENVWRGIVGGEV